MKKNLNYYNFLLLIVVLVWGAGFIAVEYLINAKWSTNIIMTSRFLIASLVLFIVFFKKIMTINKKELLYGLILGIIIYLAFFFQTIGQNYTNLSNVAFFTATNVVMIPFITWFISKKRPSYKVLALCFLCLLGVFILNFKEGSFKLRIGDLLTLFSAFCFAMHISFLDRITKEVDPIKINFLQIFFSFVISFIILIFTKPNFTGMNFKMGVIPIIFLGLFSTCLCYFLQTYAQKYTEATSAGIILSLEGFFGSLFSVMLGIEMLSPNLVIGGLCIILSTILVNINDEKKEQNNE